MKIRKNASRASLMKRIKDLEARVAEDARTSEHYKRELTGVLARLYNRAATVVGDAPASMRWLLRHEMVPNDSMDALRDAVRIAGSFDLGC